jgi:O-antigen/teichoic acid export membrane protein
MSESINTEQAPALISLKQTAIRGGLAKLFGQAVNLVLRIFFVAAMARLLDPADFGLVAMVTVITGFYGLFTDAGLSTATIQKAIITNEQISTLFWINLLVGLLLALLCVLTAPLIVRFYDEPRLFWIMIAMAGGFIINAAGVQHAALLNRDLRFVAMTVINLLCQLAGIAVGIGMALAGYGYWALVASMIAPQVMFAAGVWTIVAWTPGLPRRRAGTRSLLRFGGTVTLNGLVVYLAYNLEKLLLGRLWGADVLGLYGRAYQLINIPTENLNTAIGGVTFSALSRLQHDPARLNSYFLKGYRLANSLTLPTTMFCALFADDIVLIVLGPKWMDCTTIFRFLSPTILVFGMINPFGWLLISTGLQQRSLKLALVIAPLVITAYGIGLPFGPSGVALAYSTAMMIWLVPHILWCVQGTAISPRDVLLAITKPLVSALLAAAIAFCADGYIAQLSSPYLRLAAEGSVMFMAYYGILLFVMGDKALYLDLFRGLRTVHDT